jgi:hypothetical protein
MAAGITVELRWSVGDWSKEITTETDAGNYRTITSEGVYKAKVPVERYETPAQVYVHLYAGGKARVVSSEVGSGNSHHPILDDDPHAAERATAGAPMPDIFTKEELAAMNRKGDERKKKHGGRLAMNKEMNLKVGASHSRCCLATSFITCIVGSVRPRCSTRRPIGRGFRLQVGASEPFPMNNSYSSPTPDQRNRTLLHFSTLGNFQ